MTFIYDDGGRAACGFQGDAGDCVTRAISIIAERSYSQVYFEMATINSKARKTKRRGKSAGTKSARNGIYTRSKAFKDYMVRLGFRWVPTMQISSGCKVHLLASELPKGRLIVAVSKHYVAMVDGVIRDTYDPSRAGTRCVYGYWTK